MKSKLPLVLGIFVVGTAFAAEPTVDEIVAKLTQALGGTEKIKSVYSLRSTSRLQVQGLEGEASVVSTMKVPQMVYTEITRGESTFIECFDGEKKWSRLKSGGPIKQATDEEAKNYSQDTWVMVDGPLVGYKEKGNIVEYLGPEEVQGKATYKMHVTMKSGNTTDIFVDKATNLPFKQISRAEKTGSETVYFMLNYKTFDGFTLPTNLLIKAGGGPPVRLIFDKIEFNFPLEAAFFKMPQS
ncbi:MAG TPA: hypothetical protein VIX89_04535 [Bryobacteraceae bacterium]